MSAAVQTARGVHPQASPTSPLTVRSEMSESLSDCNRIVFGLYVAETEFKMKRRVVSECCYNHCKCSYFKILVHELGEAAG